MVDLRQAVVAVFPRLEDAEAAAEEVRAAGVSQAQLLPCSDDERQAVSALEEMGIPTSLVRQCEAQYRDGGSLLAMRIAGQQRQVQDILFQLGAAQVYTGAPEPTDPDTARSESEAVRRLEHGLLKSKRESAARGRGLEPSLTADDEPITQKIERQRHGRG